MDIVSWRQEDMQGDAGIEYNRVSVEPEQPLASVSFRFAQLVKDQREQICRLVPEIVDYLGL